MRAFILMTAMACAVAVTGCDDPYASGQYASGEYAEAPPPRVNLYPLSSPPPGSVQPLQGYAPPRIQATQYGPEVYRDGEGNVELAARNPAPLTLSNPFGANAAAVTAEVTYPDAGFPATTATYAAAPAAYTTDASGFTDASSFVAQPAVYDATMATTTTTYAVMPVTTTVYDATAQTYTAAPATFTTTTLSPAVTATQPALSQTALTAAAALGFSTDPNDPNSPYYCPPGSEFCPVPGSPIGAPVAATPAATFGFGAPGVTVDAQTVAATSPQTTTVVYAAAPAPAPVITAPAYTATTYTTANYATTSAYAPPAAPVTTTAAYVPPALPPVPVPAPAQAAYTPPATTYSAAPLRLSATAAYAPPAYTPPAYTPPAPRAAAAQPYPPAAGLSFGEVEGTADLVGPLPSLDPIVRPAYAAPYAPAPYGAAPAAPAYPAAPAPAGYVGPYAPPLSMNAAPAASPAPVAERPAPLLSSTARPAIRSAESSVAGVRAQSAASANAAGYKLVPAPDVPPGNHPNDFGPSQWFEVVRPGNGPVRIGRLSVTCTCVGARIPKRHYEAGERILVEARMLSKPAVNEVTYGLYVNILEPVETVVDADVTLRY